MENKSKLMVKDYFYEFISVSDVQIHSVSMLDDMPKLVRGDSARVVQIFSNLISNSLKFTTCKCIYK